MIRIRDIKSGFTNTYTTERYDERYLINGGDLLIGMDGEFTLTKWNSECALLNQRVCRIRSKSPLLLDDYLQYFLPSTLRKIENRTSYVTVKHLSAKVLNAVDVPLVSVEEQQRISHQFKTIDQLIEESESSVTRLDALVKSRFVEMFGSRDVGYKYPSKPLGELATFKSGASLPKDREKSSGDVIYAKVGDLNLTENSLAIVTSRVFVDAKTAGKHIIPEGAVVFPKRGGAIATNKKRITVQECCLDLNLMSVIPGKKLGTRYLLAWFDSFDLADIANGSAVPQINNKDLNPLQIPLPPLSLQQEFATCVAQVDKLRFAGNHEMNFRCERFTLS